MSIPVWDPKQLADYMTDSARRLSGPRLAILLTTPFCGTCKLALQMLQIVAEAKPHWPMVQISTTEHRQRFEDWRIESVPCILLLNDAIEAARWYRIGSVTELWQQLELFFDYPHLRREQSDEKGNNHTRK